jgi:hypothetical protein
MHVRQFIEKSLYQPTRGYFEHLPVNEFIINNSGKNNKNLMNFASIPNLKEWNNYLLMKQQDKTSTWNTPSELFQPYYSHCIAKWILSRHTNNNNNKPLNIVEIGGGNGTNALHIMNYLNQHLSSKYSNFKINYTLCEISPEMYKKQCHTLSTVKNINIIQQDFLQWNQGIQPENTFILALEVLDNLPHDKFRFKFPPPSNNNNNNNNVRRHRIVVQPFNELTKHLWKEIMVNKDEYGRWMEYEQDIEPKGSLSYESAEFFLQQGRFIEPFNTQNGIKTKMNSIHDYLRVLLMKGVKYKRDLMEKSTTSSSNYQDFFIPTGMLQFSKTIAEYFPQAKLFITDFDELPMGEFQLQKQRNKDIIPGLLVGCINSPIVSGSSNTNLEEKKRIDYPTYLIEWGKADIFFQVNFGILKELILVKEQEKKNGKDENRLLLQDTIEIYRSKDFFLNHEVMKNVLREEIEHLKVSDGENLLGSEFFNTGILIRG